ncbi:hypothetical protein ACFV90_33815 [Streptomyces sp. NPDC059904]|uniref:hypothetical protein n=1 Tax=Streptomyces sp. NPDC059904 TaxID=3346996 RepID=UPI003668FF74
MTTERRAEILDYLKAEHGITRVTMAWLRNRYDTSWDKLSRPRADAIAAWLKSEIVLHQPAKLPSRETEYVTLYSQQTGIGVFMAAARGEGFFEDKAEIALMMLRSYAKSLAEQGAKTAAPDTA